MKLTFTSIIFLILLTSCNYSYNISTSNKNSKKENPVNVSIVKTDTGFEYYVGNELVSEFTKDNCDEKEMELLEYVYNVSVEERDNKPKEERVKPKRKLIVENLK